MKHVIVCLALAVCGSAQAQQPSADVGLTCHAGGVLVCLERKPDQSCARFACDFSVVTAREAEEQARRERIRKLEAELEELKKKPVRAP